ncbi:MAG TPA: 50S ribosomal protein L23 [Patescibacteria group bacterium]|jgi:large subunit ribosomal protein L23|nr:50S ribosomal protein L23 [Patescibacteria group bacterium]
MAIFSKKENTEDTQETAVETTPVVTEATPDSTIMLDATSSRSLVVPRISEKAGKMNALNKYVFTVLAKTNKIEARKSIEALYGVKIATVNMITMAGRTRRFGRRTGTTAAYKKAIVTLKPGSKKIDLVEPS